MLPAALTNGAQDATEQTQNAPTAPAATLRFGYFHSPDGLQSAPA